MIRTNHSPSPGRAIGKETLPRPALERILTNRTPSGRDGSDPNGFSISRRTRSLPSQHATLASNGSLRRSSAKNFTRSGFSNYKRACSADTHDVIGAQFLCEHAWAKCSVPSNVNPAEENNESHTASCGSNYCIIHARCGIGDVAQLFCEVADSASVISRKHPGLFPVAPDWSSNWTRRIETRHAGPASGLPVAGNLT